MERDATILPAMSSRTTSSAVTDGIRVTVKSRYLPEHSTPGVQHYVFAYTVTVVNEGDQVVQLVSRHWLVTHGDGRVEEVRGPGVVGEQPVMGPRQGFEYTSGCVLRTPRGTMHGSYQMVREEDGETFDVEISEFALEMPWALN